MFAKIPKEAAQAEPTQANVQPVYPDSVANPGMGECATNTSESDQQNQLTTTFYSQNEIDWRSGEESILQPTGIIQLKLMYKTEEHLEQVFTRV